MTPVEYERERCASLADDLATRWESSAAKMREAYTIKPLWFGKPYVMSSIERDVKVIDLAVQGLRTVARLIRSGAVQQFNGKERQAVRECEHYDALTVGFDAIQTENQQLRAAVNNYLSVFDCCCGTESVSPIAFALARQGLRDAVQQKGRDGK